MVLLTAPAREGEGVRERVGVRVREGVEEGVTPTAATLREGVRVRVRVGVRVGEGVAEAAAGVLLREGVFVRLGLGLGEVPPLEGAEEPCQSPNCLVEAIGPMLRPFPSKGEAN